MPTKAQRQHHLAKVIETKHPANQTDLVRHLARVGIETTQGTLSRDLRELGVIKSPSGYQFLTEAKQGSAAGNPASFTGAVRRLLIRVSQGGTQVVLRTAPGQASALAIEIDRASDDGLLSGVLGTIAGDDCIFVACASVTASRSVARSLESIVHLSAATANSRLSRAHA